jgi:hypothetical protein
VRWLEWRYLLEMANGLWTIILFYIVVFLAYHLVKVGVQRRLFWRGWIHQPTSVQLAVGVWVASIGVLGTRYVTWYSRYENDGHISMTSFDTGSFVLCTVIGAAGFMCILRVITKPVLGHWPWVTAMLWCLIYLAWTISRLS